MLQKPAGFDRTIAIAFFGYIALGLADGLLGIAWPSIRDNFGLTQSAVGVFFLASTAGFILTSFSSGPLLRRFGAGPTQFGAFAIRGMAMTIFLIAPSWNTIIIAGFLIGLGTGLIDAGLNTYVAGYRSTRLMNWLHACYGLGATLGPLLMSTIIDSGYSWRIGYLAVGGFQLVLAATILLTLASWKLAASVSSDENGAAVRTASILQTLRIPLVWFGIAFFLLYTGLEVSAGQWSYTLFTESRGIAPGAAGLWVSLYWGSFTLGRAFFGMVGDRFPVVTLLRVAGAGMLVGLAMIWLNPDPAFNFIGLIVLGFMLAPVFPMLIGMTPARVGPRHAANTIGFQVGAASVGVSIVPWIAGILAEQGGTHIIRISELLAMPSSLMSPTADSRLEAIPPFLLMVAVVLVGLHELLVRSSARRKATRLAPAEQITPA